MQPADVAPLVIVKGMAGTAKTFYSLAVGLEKMINRPTGEYRRILVCRPLSDTICGTHEKSFSGQLICSHR